MLTTFTPSPLYRDYLYALADSAETIAHILSRLLVYPTNQSIPIQLIIHYDVYSERNAAENETNVTNQDPLYLDVVAWRLWIRPFKHICVYRSNFYFWFNDRYRLLLVQGSF